ncbi:chemotaxis protein CheA [Georgenia yuyongxinii]|uniref:histidine kinase n=1 Tax=Georgenia yuyongxinii TaxID=2589797 RepID=A0A552WJH8_9MICO|nr:chemotaxis protein CheA [Georgenia yuyongxinii]TRW42915.1 chemotaxis protein CheA [Georgenia yuyongxinii]
MDDEMAEIIDEFLVESRENLDQLDRDLVTLETTPGSRDLLNSIFRTLHTIKGTSGFLALGTLERLTHAGEALLVDLRDGRRSLAPGITDLLLALADTVRAVLDGVAADGRDDGVDVQPLIAEIESVRDGAAPGRGHVPGRTGSPVAAEPDVVAAPDRTDGRHAPVGQDTTATVPAVALGGTPDPDRLAPARTGSLAPEGPVEATLGDTSSASSAPGASATPDDRAGAAGPGPDGRVVGHELAAPGDPGAPSPNHRNPDHPNHAAVPDAGVSGTDAPALTEPHQPGHNPVAATAGAQAPRPNGEATVRVRVELLDHLMQQAGQLVVLRNRIAQTAAARRDGELRHLGQQLDVVTDSIQDAVLRSRMQPVEHLFAALPRMVRGLAGDCAKQVNLTLIGGETEADRSLLEAVKDPLTHLVRNAVDHGIEDPAERVAAGKPPVGTLTVQAIHAAGHVVIEVIDDGRGIDADAVADRAVTRGLRTAEQVAAMSTAEILQLLFQPGFSTADHVSHVSGRGVGMDVVRTKVEAVSGTVNFTTEVGVGTSWHLRIPLTVAIVPILSVACAGEVYALPQSALRELVAVRPGATGIEHVGTAPVYRHRGKLLPVVRLDEALGLPARPDADGALVVLKSAGRRFVLVVDRVLDDSHTMLTPLPERLGALGAYLGAMLHDDGTVGLVLDPRAIARSAGVVMGVAVPETSAPPPPAAPEPEQLLVCAIGDGRRVAVPVRAVVRIERVATDRLERVGRHEVVQVRGVVVPVIRLDRVLGVTQAADPDDLVTVLYHVEDRVVALVVRAIVDIVTDVGRHSAVEDTGLLGSAVLDERVTELLDGDALVAAVSPAFFGAGPDGLEEVARELVRP